jgi:drug/metabolite transporter (DMT)-like permease
MNSRSPGVTLIVQARVLLVGATILWGVSFPLMRGLELAQRDHAPHVPDSTLAGADVAMRFGLAALLLLPFYGRGLLNVTRREWSQAGGLALFSGIGLYLQTLGLAWTDASIAAFLTQLYTLIVPLIVALRDRRFPGPRVIVACLLVLIGVALLSPGILAHFFPGPGEIVIMVSTVFLAAQIVWVERPAFAENRSGLVTLVMFLALTAMFTFAYAAGGGTKHDLVQLFGTPALAILSLLLVLLCTLFNFFIMNAWQRYVTATEAGLIYCLEPVIAAILCSFLPGWLSRLTGISYANETLTWTLFIGGFLIVAAAVLVATQPRE